MQQNVAFHQDLHCLQRQNRPSEKNIFWQLKPVTPKGKIDLQGKYFLAIKTSDPLIYTIENPYLVVSNFIEKCIGLQRVYLHTWECTG